MHKITVLYPQGELDETYYEQNHAPLVQRHLQALGAKRFFYERLLPGPDGAAPPYRLIAHFFFDDASSLQRAMRSPEMGELVRDIKNFYPGRVQVLVGEVKE